MAGLRQAQADTRHDERKTAELRAYPENGTLSLSFCKESLNNDLFKEKSEEIHSRMTKILPESSMRVHNLLFLG